MSTEYTTTFIERAHGTNPGFFFLIENQKENQNFPDSLIYAFASTASTGDTEQDAYIRTTLTEAIKNWKSDGTPPPEDIIAYSNPLQL